jgi:transposase
MNMTTTIGMDLGDKSHEVYVLNQDGERVLQDQVVNTKVAIRKFFTPYKGALVVIEAGTHSAWVSRELEALGCEVLVGNPRKLRAIWSSERKSDVRDAEMLARIGRMDRKLLYPIHHRGKEAQQDLAVLKARDMLVRSRVHLVGHVRSTVKTMGERLPSWSTECFASKAKDALPPELVPALLPMLEEIASMTERIRAYDKKIASLIKQRHPDANRLNQVPGVGPVTSLTYVLSLEDAGRFKKSRTVGAYLGMAPRRDQSGQTDKQLRITKTGDNSLRRLLVGCAQYILGPFGEDCELQRFGRKIATRGGKNAKRRAAVAVARKLSVLLHRLWVSGETYDPEYQTNRKKKAA